MQAGGKLTIYDDGRCAFCQWAERLMLRFDADRRLEFRDYNEPGAVAETPFTLEQLSYRMHVQTPDGAWHAGYFGWVAILSALPTWRWLAPILRIWPLRWLGPHLYQFVANHRYRIPVFLLRWLKVPAPCPPTGCPIAADVNNK